MWGIIPGAIAALENNDSVQYFKKTCVKETISTRMLKIKLPEALMPTQMNSNVADNVLKELGGKTLLHIAVQKQRTQVVRWMIDNFKVSAEAFEYIMDTLC